jgi:hypothetical protein
MRQINVAFYKDRPAVYYNGWEDGMLTAIQILAEYVSEGEEYLKELKESKEVYSVEYAIKNVENLGEIFNSALEKLQKERDTASS